MDWSGFGKSSDMDSDTEKRALVATQKGRKNIRNIKELEDLGLSTKIAYRNEKERILRLENFEKKFKDAFNGEDLGDELILDYDFENKVPLISVNKVLVKKLKHHQKKGVKFMWNSCYESVEQAKISDGSGCIIAHCMGLGKTFQVITLVYTLLTHQKIGTKRILIFCPKNTLMNWINEFQMWITPDIGFTNVYNPTRFQDHSERLREIMKWHTNGGVCVINYELFRILLDDESKDSKQFQLKLQIQFQEYLCNPGPDLVICDEGHVLKNEDTKLYKIMSRIRTMRRIVLTGTPLQNNLKEYHCMVQFVKPNLLGTRNEFTNMFVNPILNGQYENSLVEDVQLMKERSHILHKTLQGVVQRFDLATLQSFLPEKQEYAIFVALTETQSKLYRFYLDNYSAKKNLHWSDNAKLLADYQSLQRIWTHPYTLKIYADNPKTAVGGGKKKSKRKKKIYDHSSEDENSYDEVAFEKTRYPLNFWVQFANSDDVHDARQSNKLVLLLKILKDCEEANEKILVFSVSLYSLQMIEHFLKRINNSEFEDSSLCYMASTWEEEEDYLVLTGDTSSEDRDKFCKLFNDTTNTRLRLFLISTKAGGMGINLTAANRAILFDVSWNPSHDTQSIFRIYRIGQKKPCFIYRLVASGTMEEKIYERQVTKQSISYRVVDEKQIARHYTDHELLALYLFEPDRKQKINTNPKDPVLQKILFEESKIITGLHEHESLLEHKEEEELQEMQKHHAWSAYNNDNDVESLSAAEVAMLSELTPNSFDPLYLRMVLERKYSKATDEEITTMMTQLMPRINEILKRSDFIDIMKREARYLSKTSQVQLTKAREKAQKKDLKNDGIRNYLVQKENQTIDLTEDTPLKKGYFSGSDDSLFLYNIGKKKKKKAKRKPLKIWGTRNGRLYGSPDLDSD